jgi:hypothetical protein
MTRDDWVDCAHLARLKGRTTLLMPVLTCLVPRLTPFVLDFAVLDIEGVDEQNDEHDKDFVKL